MASLRWSGGFMAVYQTMFSVETGGRGSYNITSNIEQFVAQSGIQSGLCQVFVQHTSASLMITENADPSVRRDIEYWLASYVQDGDEHFEHTYEGVDDMSAHLRTLLTNTSHTIPVSQGRLNLGVWQGLFLYEHRIGHFRRQMVVTIYGE
jgi:secondary thiamine-phosphate synthase enzyme